MDRKSLAILFILPLAYLSALLTMQIVATPYWLWVSIDPSYFYLMNGLEVAMGQAPADIHHPGTTTQVIAGLALRLAHPLASNADLTDMVLGAPETAVRQINLLNDALIVAAMLFAGIEATRLFGRVTLPALLIQATPFLSTVMLVNAYPAKPEATLVAVGGVLAGLLCRLMRTQGKDSIAALGLLAAFATVTKLHAFTIGVIPLFLWRDPRAWVRYVLAGLAGLALFSAPIWSEFDQLRDWFFGMAGHTGAYGAGETGLLPKNYLFYAVMQLRRPIFSAPLILGLVTLWFRRRDLPEAERPMARVLAGICVAQILHILLVAKNPVSYYLIPAFLSMGVAMALTITLARPLISVTDRAWRLGWSVVALVLVITQTTSIRDAIQNRLREKATSDAVDMTPFAACTHVNMDFASSQDFALMLGNWMAGWRFGSWASQHLPADTFLWVPYNGAAAQNIQQWDATQFSVADITTRRVCTVFRGTVGQTLGEWIKRDVPGIALNSCSNGDEWVLSVGIPCEGAFPSLGAKSLRLH